MPACPAVTQADRFASIVERLAMRALMVIILAATLTAGSSLGQVGSSALSQAQIGAASSRTLPIEGYLMDADGALAHLTANASGIAMVGVDGVAITSKGAGLTATPDITGGVVSEARRRGLKTELLVSNYSESLGDFSPTIAGRLLRSAKHRRAVAKALARRVVAAGYGGVQLDLESLKRSDGPGLTAFAKQLRAALPGSKRLSMAVMAGETVSEYRDSGYELAKLKRIVDRFVLMAYDEHGPGWSASGPVGGTPWVKRVLAAFLRAGVPQAKTDLGVAQYGYSWPGSGKQDRSLSVAQARTLAQGRAVFDATQQEWTATLADGTVLWWSDKDTLKARRTLAAGAGIHGLAVWELSLCDVIAPS
jgi:spore germination protein YaaH